MAGFDLDRVNLYAEQSRHYEANALHLLAEGEPAKAGEMLWGATAELLKAIGLVHGRPVTRDDLLAKVAQQIAITTRDAAIDRGWKAANAMHANFYENHLEGEEYSTKFVEALEGIARLRGLLSSALRTSVTPPDDVVPADGTA